MAVQNNLRLFYLFYFLIILQLTQLRISSSQSPTSSPVPSPSPDSTLVSSPSPDATSPSPSSGPRSTLGPASGPSPYLPPTSAPTPSLGPASELSPSSGPGPASGLSPSSGPGPASGPSPSLGPAPSSGLASGPSPSLGPAPSSGPASGPSPSSGPAPFSGPISGPSPSLGLAPSSGPASGPSPSSGPAPQQASGPSSSLRSASVPAPSISDGPAGSEGLYELDSSPTLAPSADVDPKVKELCDSTDHSALCLATVVPLLEGKTDISSVLNVAIRAGAQVSRYGLFLAQKLAGDPENSPEFASVLNDCTTFYSFAVDNYESAIDAYPEHDIGTMNSRLSAVITNVGDCEDALPDKGPDFPLTSVSVKLRNMTSNCLAIVSLLD